MKITCKVFIFIHALMLIDVVPAPSAQNGSAALRRDVLPEYHNLEVMALVEDVESVRLATGAAWDDALTCRTFSGYLRAWTKDDSRQQAETIVKRGTSIYELVKCVDDGINS